MQLKLTKLFLTQIEWIIQEFFFVIAVALFLNNPQRFKMTFECVCASPHAFTVHKGSVENTGKCCPHRLNHMKMSSIHPPALQLLQTDTKFHKNKWDMNAYRLGIYATDTDSGRESKGEAFSVPTFPSSDEHDSSKNNVKWRQRRTDPWRNPPSTESGSKETNTRSESVFHRKRHQKHADGRSQAGRHSHSGGAAQAEPEAETHAVKKSRRTRTRTYTQWRTRPRSIECIYHIENNRGPVGGKQQSLQFLWQDSFWMPDSGESGSLKQCGSQAWACPVPCTPSVCR